MRLALALALPLAACGAEGPDPCEGGPSYERDIAPIVAARCTSCHSEALFESARAGAPVGVDLDTPDLAEPRFDAIADAITSGRMPPSDGPPTTTREERALASAWRACGLPRTR
jgi:uncharacterized membrane protein